jgi:hypothetical protein
LFSSLKTRIFRTLNDISEEGNNIGQDNIAILSFKPYNVLLNFLERFNTNEVSFNLHIYDLISEKNRSKMIFLKVRNFIQNTIDL